jgi:hypothetical protein
MKILDALLYLFCIAGALAGYFLLAPPLSFAVIGLCVAFAAWTLFASNDSGEIVLRLGGLSWSMEDFVRGWLITGRTGSGKTQCAINTITYQIFQNVPRWGDVCLDQKGLYWEILLRMAARFGREGDLTLLQTRPVGKDALWRPAHTINITGNPNVPASTYAKVIVDTAVSLTGGRGQNPFFPTKAQIAIQTGFEVLRHIEAYVTIPNIHRLLLHEEDANAAIETLMNKGDQRSHELVVALRDGFFAQPPEQLGGVQGTLSTYLEFFTDPEIAEVFCANEPTFSMDQIDAGKIVCIAMPQKFQAERLYINTILKLSYYFHALSRFDKPAEEREKENLIVLFADEGSLDRRYADVLMLNLSNELIFTVANHDSAVIASKNIGERAIVEKTWGWAAGKPSYNYQRVIKPYFPAFKLRRLPKFTAILRRCEKPFRKRLIPPINPDGSYPDWFTRQRPDYAAWQRLRKRFPNPRPDHERQ